MAGEIMVCPVPIEPILDRGAEGLRFFAEYLPRYQRVDRELGFGRKDIAEYGALCARYDAERGMDAVVLHEWGEAVRQLRDMAARESAVQRKQLTALPVVWQGAAADQAARVVGGQVRRAEDDIGRVSAIVGALQQASMALVQAVSTKADTVAGLWLIGGGAIDGTPPAGVDFLIAAARQYHCPADKALGMPVSTTVAKKCFEWLRDHLIPRVEQAVARFEDICRDTETQVKRVYGDLSTQLERLDTAPYPSPPDPGAPPNPFAPPNSPPSGVLAGEPSRPPARPTSTAPSGAGPGPGGAPPRGGSQPAGGGAPPGPGETPPGEVPPGAPNVVSESGLPSPAEGLSGLSDLVEKLGPVVTGVSDLVGKGIETVSGPVAEGLAGAMEKLQDVLNPQAAAPGDDPGPPGDPAPPPGSPPIGPAATPDLPMGDERVALMRTPDDGVEMVLTDPSNGQQKHYRVELDEHGAPRFAPSPPIPPPVETEADGEHSRPKHPAPKHPPPPELSAPPSTPQPGQQPSPGQSSLDREAGNGTGPGPASPQHDTGARLSEAGPL